MQTLDVYEQVASVALLALRLQGANDFMVIKESELVNKWVWQFHPTALQWRRVRLGVVPGKEMAREYMVILRWADLVFVENGIVHIVEAKLRPDAGAIGQLEHYKLLFSRTPEFSQYWNYPVELILLTSYMDLEIVELCSKKGIKYEFYEIKE